MSVHVAKALIGCRMSSGSCHNYCVSLWNGVRTMSLLGFVLEVDVPRGGWKLAVLRQHHVLPYSSAVEATVDLLCKIVCFNQLFGDMTIFGIVLSKNDNFLNVLQLNIL